MEKLSANTNALNWFEIPASDIARAKKFYESIFEITMEEMPMPGLEMIVFPSEQPKSGGAIVKSQFHTPSKEGSIIYLNANPDLQPILDRIKSSGGEVTMPKTKISDEIGYMAYFIDSEGNSVGLHSIK